MLYLDFATCTMDLICAGSTVGSDCTTRVRMLCSVAEGGKDVRKRDIFTRDELDWSCYDTGKTYDGLVFGWLQPHCGGMLCQDLPRNGIIAAMVSVLDVLFRKLIVHWHLVSKDVVRTCYASTLTSAHTCMDNPGHDCTPPWQRTSRHVGGYACSKGPCAQAVSASPFPQTMPSPSPAETCSLQAEPVFNLSCGPLQCMVRTFPSRFCA